MGGTTAKITIIENQKAIKAREFEVDRKARFKKGSGLPLRIPVIEMVEIGAGGGSIARVNKLDQIITGPDRNKKHAFTNEQPRKDVHLYHDR